MVKACGNGKRGHIKGRARCEQKHGGGAQRGHISFIRNAEKGEVSPRLEKEVEAGLECQEIIINSQNGSHFTLIIYQAQAGGLSNWLPYVGVGGREGRA